MQPSRAEVADHASTGAANAPPTIVFARADGFPAGTCRVLFDAWRAAGYRICAVERFGHDPRCPVTNNWAHWRDQLIHYIDHEAGTPAFLVGHSLGACTN